MKKFLVAFAMFLFVLTPALIFLTPMSVTAGDDKFWGDGNKDAVGDLLDLPEEDPRIVIAGIINVILGFLGILAVIIILLGGFKWMTAGGNEEKVEEAKKLIISGAIGLVIIISAWAIATFIIDAIYSAAGG